MNRVTKRKLITCMTVALAVVVVFSALSLAASWEIEAEEMSERHYCERVQDGTHRHFNKRINCGSK